MSAWLKKHVSRGFRSADERPEDVTLGVTRFEALLRREFARSDRNGHSFALVTVSLPPDTPTSVRDRLVSLVWQRMRATDSAGWIRDGERLGTVLFECPEAAAQRFGTYVVDHLASDEVTAEFDVYRYPGTLPEYLEHLVERRGAGGRAADETIIVGVPE